MVERRPVTTAPLDGGTKKKHATGATRLGKWSKEWEQVCYYWLLPIAQSLQQYDPSQNKTFVPLAIIGRLMLPIAQSLQQTKHKTIHKLRLLACATNKPGDENSCVESQTQKSSFC